MPQERLAYEKSAEGATKKELPQTDGITSRSRRYANSFRAISVHRRKCLQGLGAAAPRLLHFAPLELSLDSFAGEESVTVSGYD